MLGDDARDGCDRRSGRADAASCPDVEVFFARGTVETAPPVRLTGLAFSAELRRQLPGKSVSVWGVPYKATDRFSNRRYVAQTAIDGISMVQRRMTRIASVCRRRRSSWAVTRRARSSPPTPPRRRDCGCLKVRTATDRSATGTAVVGCRPCRSGHSVRGAVGPVDAGHRHTTAACRNAVPRQDLPLLHPRRHHLQRRQVGQPNALHVLYGTMSAAAARTSRRNASDSASGVTPRFGL